MQTHTLTDGTTISYEDQGAGAPTLVLHGGGGPFTVAGLVAHLAGTARVLAPTHPGWNGLERPAAIDSIAALAATYLELLRELGLRNVRVIGSSLGGWLALDMAQQDTADLVGSITVIDGTGIQVADAPMPDFFSLTPRGIAEHSWFDADRYFVDPTTVPQEQRDRQIANMATMRVLAGDPYMWEPGLFESLRDVHVPALLVWGDSDRIVTPVYGRALAAALPDSRFELITRAGHLPHLEQPQATLDAIDAFLSTQAVSTSALG